RCALPCRARRACPSRPIVALRSAHRRRRSARRPARQKRQRQLGPQRQRLRLPLALVRSASTSANDNTCTQHQRQRRSLHLRHRQRQRRQQLTPPSPPPSLPSLPQLLQWKGGRCGGGGCDRPAACPSLPSFSLHCSACPSAPPLGPLATAAIASAATASSEYCATMASLRVLAFDHEGRPVSFDTWHNDLQLYLLSVIKDSVSLFDHVSGVAPAPPATTDGATRSHWLSRDATARLAIRNHLPVAECTHFGQHRTAQALYDAVAARYSSHATAALRRLLLPYLFPELSAFTTVADMVTHQRTNDTRYRATVPAEFLATNQPPMFITLYFIVSRLPDSLRSARDHFLSLDPTSLTVDLLDQHLLADETSAVAGCSPSPLSPSFAFAAAADVFVPEDVGAASTSAKRRSSKGKSGQGGGGGGSGSGGGGSCGGGGGSGGGGGGGTGGGSGGSGGGGGGGGESGNSGGGGSSGGRSGPPRGGPGGGQRHAEGECYQCVPSDPGIAAAALGASASGTPPGTVPAEALHTFTLDSGASRCFFHDSTTLTPLPAPVPVRLDDPSGGLVIARSSTVLPCLAVLSGSLSGLHLPSFSTNLVSTAALQDAMVTTTTHGGQRVSICTCTRMGRHLATFTPRPGSSLYTLATEPTQVAASAQKLLWHHRLGHPSLPRLRGMHSRFLVSCLLRSLPPLPPSPALPCLPCVEGRQRAAPHSSSFPLTTAPLQTLHMDVWGPAGVSGQGRERYFLLVVDDYTRYTTVFPLRSNGEVPDVLIPWIRTVCLQLRERFGTDLPVLRLHSDKGGEFSSNLLPDFCRGEGIFHSFMLPNTPQQNGIAERCIGLVMEVAHTSMIHAATPHFLRSFAVWYAAHQLNLWPRVWGSCAFVRDTSADKLSARAISCVFLGFVLDATGWQFYHPTSRRVLPSQDVTFNESVPFYRLFPYRSAPPPPPPLFLALGSPLVDPLPPKGPAPSAGGAEPGGVEPGGAESEGAESGGAEPRGAASSGGPAGASPQLSSQQLLGAGDTGGAAATGPGGARSSGAGAAGTSGVGCAGAGDPTEPGAAGVGGAGAGEAGPASPLLAPSLYTEQSGGLTERREPASRPVSSVHTTRCAPRLRPPLVPGTHAMALRPSSVPLRVPLPAPPESSLPEVPDPASDRAHAASPTVPRLLATAVTDPSFESAAASPLVVELLDFAASCRLDYASALVAESVFASPTSVGSECALGTDVLEDRQEDFECLAAVVPRFASMLLAPEGDPDALDLPTPRSYAKAITGTYINAVPPSRANIVDGMWIFRVKRLPGSPPAFKARYVARGFNQRQGVDYFQNFSPTPKMTTIRVLLHVAAQHSFPVGQLAQGDLAWHDTLRTTLAALGLAPSTADPLLFLRTDTSLPPFYVLVYVDDLVFATADTKALTLVKLELQKRHTCTDLGELRNYLGLYITQDRTRRTITLPQSHMVHQVLQRFGFQFSSPQPTPLSTNHSLSAPPLDESLEPSGLYPELVGCLMYLMTCTRPDLEYPLSLVACYEAPGRHRKVHWDATKRVLCYLCSTSGMGLVLGGRGPVVLTGHAHASWVDDSATQRSSQGYTFSLGATLAHLPTERLGELPRLPPVLYVDNKAMIALCQEHRQEHRTKHIALRYFLA
ncbi:unnamed protein product, partial [Closterium sp. NIES-54]